MLTNEHAARCTPSKVKSVAVQHFVMEIQCDRVKANCDHD